MPDNMKKKQSYYTLKDINHFGTKFACCELMTISVLKHKWQGKRIEIILT